MKPRRVNVDRMRRYRGRSRERYVWSKDERMALLAQMYGTLDRWREEDEPRPRPGYHPYGFDEDGTFHYFDPLKDGIQRVAPRRSPKRCTVDTSAHDQHEWDEVGPVITSLHVCPGAPF